MLELRVAGAAVPASPANITIPTVESLPAGLAVLGCSHEGVARSVVADCGALFCANS